MSQKKQALPQRVSPGVYRQASGNLRQMQAPRQQQPQKVQAQPMPNPGGQFPVSPGFQGPSQQMAQQAAMAGAGAAGAQMQAQPKPMQGQGNQWINQMQGQNPYGDMNQAQQMPQGFGFSQQPFNQMAQNDQRFLPQQGMNPGIQAAMQAYQQNPQMFQQTQQGMQTLMPGPMQGRTNDPRWAQAFMTGGKNINNIQAPQSGDGLMSPPPGVK